jgi:hypothetical protein
MRLSKIKTSEKAQAICEQLRNLVGTADMDWEKKTDKDGQYYEGELDNLKIYVRPIGVEIGIMRPDDAEGKIEERRKIPRVVLPVLEGDKSARFPAPSLYTELEERFGNHDLISFLKEAHTILEKAVIPPEEPKGDEDGEDKEKLLRSGK